MPVNDLQTLSPWELARKNRNEQRRMKSEAKADENKQPKDSGTADGLAMKMGGKIFLQTTFKFLWSFLGFLPALLALHVYCFTSAVGKKKVFGDMSLVQILQFLGATALVGVALLVIFFIVMVILDIYEHPFRNLKNLMEMAL